MASLFHRYVIKILFMEDGLQVDQYESQYGYDKDYSELKEYWNTLKNGGLEKKAQEYSQESQRKIKFAADFTCFTYDDDDEDFVNVQTIEYIDTETYLYGSTEFEEDNDEELDAILEMLDDEEEQEEQENKHMGRKSKEEIKKEQARKASGRYETKFQRLTFALRVSAVKDKEMFDWLMEHRPTNAYLTALVKADMEKNKK